MKNILLIILGVTANITVLFAQEKPCNCEPVMRTTPFISNNVVASFYTNPFPGKNAHFFNYWSPGALYLKDGSVISNEVFRYDAFSDELLWLRKNDSRIGVVNRNNIKSFSIFKESDSSNIVFEQFDMNNSNQPLKGKVFLQKIELNSKIVYVQRVVESIGTQNDLVEKNIYYLKSGDDLISFDLKRKSLAAILGVEVKKIKHFCKENYINVKTEEGMIKLFDSTENIK